ncbi:MAG: hypothetical protein Q9226_005206 [Calogaya cf. arnoldii]
MVTTRSKRALSEISPNTAVEPSSKKKKPAVANDEGKENASSIEPKCQDSKTSQTQASKTAKVDRTTDPKTFITLCEKGIKHKCRISPKCMCMRFASANPSHPFCLTKKGEDLYRAWRREQVKRDAEAFGVIAWTDYSGYGTAEVVGNILHAFDQVIRAEAEDIWTIWAHIEGMARFLTQDNWRFYRKLPPHYPFSSLSIQNQSNILNSTITDIDDAEANGKRVMLIGTAILTAIDSLIAADLFSPDSAIRNIGFIIALFLEFVVTYEETCEDGEDGWRFVVVKKLDDCGITIPSTVVGGRIAEGLRGLAREEEEELAKEKEENRRFEAMKDSDNDKSQEVENDPKDIPNFVNAYKPDTDPNSEFRSWQAWDWKQEVEEYTIHMGIDGEIHGTQYDLTIAANYESSEEESLSVDSDNDDTDVVEPVTSAAPAA